MFKRGGLSRIKKGPLFARGAVVYPNKPGGAGEYSSGKGVKPGGEIFWAGGVGSCLTPLKKGGATGGSKGGGVS